MKQIDEDFDWHVIRRWQSYEGELRAALLRLVLLIAFYSVQLLHYFVFSERSESEVLFHRQITFVAAAWFLVSLAVLVSLRQRYFPEQLKFATSTFDLLLLFAAAALGSGPESPLVVAFFVLIALSGMRFSLALVWWTTLGAMIAYWGLVGLADDSWFDPNHQTQPLVQLVTLCAMAATGIAVGQFLRMARNAAEHLATRKAPTTHQPIDLVTEQAIVAASGDDHDS